MPQPAPPNGALDLGSGGGLPGLVLARDWPSSTWVLLDANERRTAFLHEARDLLELGNVTIARGRAEALGRSDSLRDQFDLVTARGFGPPAVTAECAAPFLHVGGRLIVSEPPASDGERWPASGVAQVGLAVGSRLTDGGTYQVLEQREPCPERYPRRVGVPAKRPLF